jgi:hypothetical protein
MRILTAVTVRPVSELILMTLILFVWQPQGWINKIQETELQNT